MIGSATIFQTMDRRSSTSTPKNGSLPAGGGTMLQTSVHLLGSLNVAVMQKMVRMHEACTFLHVLG